MKPRLLKVFGRQEKLWKEFKEKLEELKKQFPDWRNEPRIVSEPPKAPTLNPEITDDVVKKLPKTKIGLIAAGTVTALAVVGAVVYNNLKKQGAKTQPQVQMPSPALAQTPSLNKQAVQTPQTSSSLTMQDFLSKSARI